MLLVKPIKQHHNEAYKCSLDLLINQLFSHVKKKYGYHHCYVYCVKLQDTCFVEQIMTNELVSNHNQIDLRGKS